MSAVIANPFRRRRWRMNPYIGPSHQLSSIPSISRTRKRRSDAGKKRKKRSSRAMTVYYPPAAAKVKRKKSKMAKRRKTRSDKGVSRTRRRKSKGRRRFRLPMGRVLRRKPRRGYRVGRSGRWRRGTKTVYINPRRRRRRNPGFGGSNMISTVKGAFVPYAVGFITSLGASVIDTALSTSPVVSQLIKIGGVVAIAAVFGNKNPRAAAAAIGALAAAQGYPLGVKLGGGIVATDTQKALVGLGNMARYHPEMGLLLQGGLGALLNGPSDVDAMSRNYSNALNSMSDDD